MSELNIDIICANSPQAKGCVERSNFTLQDRVVKDLRLRGICNMVAGQPYLEEFREDYNRRFARPPRNSYDAHLVGGFLTSNSTISDEFGRHHTSLCASVKLRLTPIEVSRSDATPL